MNRLTSPMSKFSRLSSFVVVTPAQLLTLASEVSWLLATTLHRFGGVLFCGFHGFGIGVLAAFGTFKGLFQLATLHRFGGVLFCKDLRRLRRRSFQTVRREHLVGNMR